MKLSKLFIVSGLIALFFSVPALAQQNGSLTGQVVDSLGAVVVGASVTTVSGTGAEKTTTSNTKGEYSISGLAPGKYTIRVSAPKFALYENTEVEITAAQKTELIPVMTVSGVEEQVEGRRVVRLEGEPRLLELFHEAAPAPGVEVLHGS